MLTKKYHSPSLGGNLHAMNCFSMQPVLMSHDQWLNGVNFGLVKQQSDARNACYNVWEEMDLNHFVGKLVIPFQHGELDPKVRLRSGESSALLQPLRPRGCSIVQPAGLWWGGS